MPNSNFTIPIARFDNAAYIKKRIALIPKFAQGAVKTALTYLYLKSGPKNLPRDRLKLAKDWVEPREYFLLRWLYTRTNGRLRSTYGEKALITARKSRFRCSECGYADVRALHIDHVDGRTADTPLSCLCANCHNIKSRKSDWGVCRITTASDLHTTRR
jgi:hypothetical protein